MSASARKLPEDRPKVSRIRVEHDGRSFPLVLEKAGYRLRSRKKSFPVDFNTATRNPAEARRRSKEWLSQNADVKILSRKGGGSLEALIRVYLDTPKKTKARVAADNVARLRAICRVVFGEECELANVTCREVGPAFWQDYQRKALERSGRKFDLTTRYRENLRINAAVRCAKAIFIPAMLRAYRAAGLNVSPDASEATPLPQPYVPPAKVDDAELLKAWAALADTDRRLWLVVGLARFAGLRREEISACRGGWVEPHRGAIHIALRDRPEDHFWTKTGKPYRARVINPELAEWLTALMGSDTHVVPDPITESRDRWFERVPQAWLKARGFTGKPLHRLRGLYADHIAQLTEDAVTAQLAGRKAAQENLGHGSEQTTNTHYRDPEKL